MEKYYPDAVKLTLVHISLIITAKCRTGKYADASATVADDLYQAGATRIDHSTGTVTSAKLGTDRPHSGFDRHL